MAKKLENFDPDKPTCPDCGKQLRQIIDVSRNDGEEFKIVTYLCTCGIVTGVIVLDNPIPDEPYFVYDTTEGSQS